MKKLNKIVLFLLFAIALVFIGIFSFSHYVENKIADSVNKNNSESYIINVENVDFKLFDRSLIFNNFSYALKLENPVDSSQFYDKKDSLNIIKIASVKIYDIHYLDFIKNKMIKIGKIEVDDVFINSTNDKKQKTNSDKKNPIRLDSIPIDKINGLEIDRFDINNVQYSIIDSITHKTLFQHKPTSFEFDGFQLKKVNDQIFKVVFIDETFKINDISFDDSNENYNLSIAEISFDTKTFDVEIDSFNYRPIGGKYTLAKKDKFNTPVFNFGIDRIKLFNLDVLKLLGDKGIAIDSVLISKGVFEFYKDNRKPFDESLRKKLPQESLKELKIPLNIDRVSIENSTILVHNQFPHKNIEMKLSIDSINGEIVNISNSKQHSKIPILIEMRAKLMNKGELKAHFKIPMDDQRNTFYFNGELGSTKFRYYDKIIYPALGLKIIEGDLDHLSFKAQANNYSSHGTMTFLYHNLDAEIFKKKSRGKSKILSWAVSTILHNSNPVKHKNIRIATMYYKHEKYRGFGGYLWKTLQSGIVNTLSPLGNKTSKKTDKIIEKNKRKKDKRK